MSKRRPEPTNPRAALMLCPVAGKLVWVSRRLAKVEARQDARRYGYPMFVYRCGHCDWWHLTKQRPWPKESNA